MGFFSFGTVFIVVFLSVAAVSEGGSTHSHPFMKFQMPNKVYDILKTVCTIILPALATLYASLSGIWGFPYTEQVVGTITAVDLFIGAIIGISSANYFNPEKGAKE